MGSLGKRQGASVAGVVKEGKAVREVSEDGQKAQMWGMGPA